MKISLSWIADHIRVDKKELNVAHVLEQFAAITAEVEYVEELRTDLSTLFLGTIITIDEQEVTLDCQELKRKLALPLRKDAFLHQVYLIKTDTKSTRWATLADVGSSKEGLMPNVSIEEKDIKGAWKHSFEVEDSIITIENKALTNRPDLWGHRGIAREIAAIIGKELVLDDYIYASLPVKHYQHQSQAQGSNPFVLQIVQANQPMWPSLQSTCRLLSSFYCLHAFSYVDGCAIGAY